MNGLSMKIFLLNHLLFILFGFLIKPDPIKNFYTLALSSSQDATSISNLISIPKKCVINFSYLS